MEYGWINCPNCDEQYVDYAERCPRCRTANPLKHDQPGISTQRVSSKTPSSRLIIIGILAAVGIVAFLVMGSGNFLGSKNGRDNAAPTNTPVPENTNDQRTGPAEQTTPVSEAEPQVPQITTVTVQKERQLLQDRTVLLPKDVKTYKIPIPNVANATLTGKVLLNGIDTAAVSLTDENHSNFCNPVSACNIVAYGQDRVPKPVDTANTFSVPLKDVSLLYVKVVSPDDAAAQLFNIQLNLSYPEVEVKTKLVQQSLGLTQRTITEVLSTADSTKSINQLAQSSSSPILTSDPSLAKYQEYALDLINKDRQKAGLSPVKLSFNIAAQKHAEDMLSTGHISHWTTDGMKPYMRYTIYNGLNGVAQNAAMGGYSQESIQGCQTGIYFCSSIDVEDQIKKAEYGMMYDDAASQWGHRDNILDKHHTDVSIGIAYNKYSFAMVQNFEDNYVNMQTPVTTDDKQITISGSLSTQDATLYDVYLVAVYYDETPTSAVYKQYRDQGFYSLGKHVATVVKPPTGGYYYQQPSDYQLLPASSWNEANGRIDISFDISQVTAKVGPGVYTVVTLLENKGDTDGSTQFPVTNYSIFIR